MAAYSESTSFDAWGPADSLVLSRQLSGNENPLPASAPTSTKADLPPFRQGGAGTYRSGGNRKLCAASWQRASAIPARGPGPVFHSLSTLFLTARRGGFRVT